MSQRFERTTERVQAAYQDGDIAGSYDERRFSSFRGRLGAWLDNRMLEKALGFAESEPERYLDVACGTGRLTRQLAARPGATVAGIDTSNEMLAVARASSDPAIDYREADGRELPFDDNSQDVVTALRFFGHLSPDVSAPILEEMSRVAKQLVVIEVSVRSPFADLRRRIEQRVKGSYLGFGEEWTWRRYHDDEIASELRAAQLVEVGRISKLPLLSDSYLVCARPSSP